MGTVDGPGPARAARCPRVGMVGAGQLARMTYQAGIPLGLTVRLLAERPGESAGLVGADVAYGSPRRREDLATFAASCDVLTFDHELVDVAALAALEADGGIVRPSSATVGLVQDKWLQRTQLAALGCPVPPHRLAPTPAAVEQFAEEHGWPVVVKARRGGYDGRGVWVVASAGDADAVFAEAARRRLELLVEGYVPITSEVAVLVARRPGGESRVYPVVETVQRDGICREIVAPAPLPPSLLGEAADLAGGIARAIDAQGILAVEMFVADDRVLVNELAARPHNSGHYSIEGCATSQFENHVRAVLDWPLGDPSLVAPAVATVNVLGDPSGADPRGHLPRALAVTGAHVHLYGKEARPGRKLGHVTVVGDDAASVRARAQDAARRLAGGAAGEGAP